MPVLCFAKTNPQENEHRWYTVYWGPTLFGAWAVACAWGRLGTSRYRQKITEFPTADQARAEAETQAERRLQREYEEIEIQ